MLARLLVACISLLIISGCGKDTSTPPKYSPLPVDTELGIYGLTKDAKISQNYLSVTIDRSKTTFRNYTAFSYIIDTPLGNVDNPSGGYKRGSFRGLDRVELIIPNLKPGGHRFAVKGLLFAENGVLNQEAGREFIFTVDYQKDKMGNGKYIGDSTLFTNISTMKVNFVSYSTSKVNDNFVGGMNLYDTAGSVTSYNVSEGAIVGVLDTNPIVSFLMTSPQYFLRGIGTGYKHFMELLLLQGSMAGNQPGTADTWGDLRLYRSDAESKVLSGYCTSLRGYHLTSPERQGVISLQSFDNINFFGHLRLWDKDSAKVWTYKAAAYADQTGLSVGRNSLAISLSTSVSPIEEFILRVNPYPALYPLIKPPGAPLPTSPGILTVVVDANGKFKINQLSLNLDDLYDATQNSIIMKATYAP